MRNQVKKKLATEVRIKCNFSETRLKIDWAFDRI